MEVHEETSKEKKQRLLIQSSLLRGGWGVSRHHLPFNRDSKAGRGVGGIYSGEKGALLAWEPVAGLIASGASVVMG